MSRRYRQPGPLALAHREHRRRVGPMAQDIDEPQYESGPRHGQQIALIKAVRSLIKAVSP